MGRNSSHRLGRSKGARLHSAACILGPLLLAIVPLRAEQLPVLRQIDLPYSAYYREMYLPQLTSGPGSVAWMPDSQSVIFSMQGVLWRQRLDSSVAEQLTDGPGYDYQPDVSADGRWVIYAKYNQDAIELWVLDLSTRNAKQLTTSGAVNLEPRWSPAFQKGDTRIVFVSTQFNRHFHIFVAKFDVAKAELNEVQRLTAETHSGLSRTLYSEIDHEISPSWSPDGKEIIFISNHNRIDGTGGLWRMKSVPVLVEAPPTVPRGPFGMMSRPSEPIVKEESRQILDERTTWRVRPDWSPDGKRVIYAAYVATPKGGGRYELRTIDADGGQLRATGEPGQEGNDFSPRWSPDGKSVAFISTRTGNFSLWIQEAAGGKLRAIVQKERKFLAPRATLRFQGTGPSASSAPLPVRISITGQDGRTYAPDDTLIYAADSFDRSQRPFEKHYFDLNVSRLRPSEAITVPPGKLHIEITHGFEHRATTMDVEVKAGEAKIIPFSLRSLRVPEQPATRWVDGDLHVGMSYGGVYRALGQNLVAQMKAENLSVLYNLVENNSEQIPEVSANNVADKTDPLSAAAHHILYGKEFHSALWGDMDVLNTGPPSVRSYVLFPEAGTLPTNSYIADLARAANSKNALVGCTNLFHDLPDPVRDTKLTHELPVDVALGKVDYYEVLGRGDPEASAAVWYSFLNLGFRLPAAAGSDAIAGYASSRGPVGRDRLYVRVPSGPFNVESWIDGLKHGRSFATNGPQLRFTLGGEQVGGELTLSAPKTVPFTATLRSFVPVDHLEVLCNGEVALSIPLNRSHDASDALGALHLARSGWCLLRAWSEKAADPVLDDYPYATTSPIYVTVAGAKPSSPKDARYFSIWVERVRDFARAISGYKSEEQKTEVLKRIEAAHQIYEQLAK